MPAAAPPADRPARRAASDAPFLMIFAVVGGLYVLLIVAMLAADFAFTSPGHMWAALRKAEIQYAITLSLVS